MDAYQDYDEYSQDYEELEGYENVEYVDEDTPLRDGMNLFQLHEECVIPTLLSAWDQLCLLFISCLLFKILTQLLPLKNSWCHIMSVAGGTFGLYTLIGQNALYTLVLGMASYWLVLICHRKPLQDMTQRIVMCSLLFYLVVREYIEILPEKWEQIRGIHMIMVLKCISVASDASVPDKPIPPFLNYIGYMFCPATIIFGPWIPFQVYTLLYDKKTWSVDWVVKVMGTILFSLVCLGISTCWIYWLFSGISSSWLLAVRDALSVRFSHYFVAYMSEATCVLAGFYSKDNPTLNVEVTNPIKIELPRSLVEVVCYWNQPMHRWLKLYVFRAAKRLGSFWGVLLTFLVSSLLHGLNFPLSMVLLSLGFYTFVEHTLREKLASIFDACIGSRACKNCKHHFTTTNPAVFLTNFAFGALAYFHLAYLGVMMDRKREDGSVFADGISHHFEAWSKLDYLSHWVVLATYICAAVI